MDEQKKLRLQHLLNYIKGHPFPVKCLSFEQARKVEELQNNPTRLEQSHVNSMIKSIYHKSEDERIFPYQNVIYLRFEPGEGQDGEIKEYVSILFSDEDFDWMNIEAQQAIMKRFDALINYYGFKGFQISYTYESLFNEYKNEYENNPNVEMLIV
jgi:hypothetical protein